MTTNKPMTAEERATMIASRLQILWNHAQATWPPLYRHAIETCLDVERPLDRDAIKRSAKGGTT